MCFSTNECVKTFVSYFLLTQLIFPGSSLRIIIYVYLNSESFLVKSVHVFLILILKGNQHSLYFYVLPAVGIVYDQVSFILPLALQWRL